MQFPIDLEQYDRREQLKKSGLGKVGMTLEESVHNFFSSDMEGITLTDWLYFWAGHYVFIKI